MTREAAVNKDDRRGGHTPVANTPESDDFEIGKLVSSPPAGGAGPAPAPGVNDGAEVIDGRTARAEAKSVLSAPTLALKDIGEASFGPLPNRAETVHGADDRVQIHNTSVYPWRVHASLQITAADNSRWSGTGWFVGPSTLITAGHVVFIKNSGVPGRDGWVKQISVMPGRNGASLPYGAVASASFRSVVGWTRDGNEEYDYGAIIIPTALGNSTGWLGFGVYSDADLLQTTGNVSGYPGDKPAGTQWYDSHRVASVNSRKVFYDIDTFGGQSGSAVYRIVNGDRYAFGIHAYGGATVNSATRIVSPVYNNILSWKAQGA
jgi:glutamyl endopeptidase